MSQARIIHEVSGEVPLPDPQAEDDFAWCVQDGEVRRRYGGLVAAVSRRTIWGTGSNHADAWAIVQRQAGHPPREELTFVVVPYVLAEADDEWAWCIQDAEVQRHYGGLVVAVNGQRIWGAGEDRSAAWETARPMPGCPPEDELTFVLVPSMMDFAALSQDGN